MTDKEIKLKCLELATEAKVSNTLGLAKDYYNWITENKIMVTGRELAEVFTRAERKG